MQLAKQHGAFYLEIERIPSSNILNQVVQAIKTAKSNVQSIQSDIRRARTNFQLNTQNELANINYQSFKTITDIESTRLKYIQEKSEEAKASGKDADQCLNNVASNMKSGSQAARSELNRCDSQGKQLLQTQLLKFDALQADGQKLINELDNIALQCYNSNINQMASCMSIKVGLVNRSIRVYQQEASQLQSNAQSQKSNIILSTSSCNNQAVNTCRSASTDAIYAAANCLKS
ncbi:hypothetical protein WH47_12104 [Habropoda laboriosa]|uniref:Protein TsetseEP domain-containing protein n=1 Tax=Habropoda laboriosa TaxID=597456 RepID=A0A0L7R191_9HYME|nr:hypothetical protein WH47_12104 [Habropoda laboriosa]